VNARSVTAVFFDVDFTLIFPGPTFQAEGYRRACAAHGIEVDPAKFEEATAAIEKHAKDECDIDLSTS